MKYTWTKSENDELWQNGTFETVEDCIADAKENYEYSAGEDIAVGVVNNFVAKVDAESVLEAIEEQAYEECGEACEGWIDYKNEAVDKLQDTLTNCLNEWLKETKQEPEFYGITNIKKVAID